MFYLSCSQDPVTNSETSNTEFSQIVCLFKSGKSAFLPQHYVTHKTQSQGQWKGLAPKLYIPSTLNTELIFWQPQWIGTMVNY